MDNTKILLIFLFVVLLSQAILKLWSLLWSKFHKIDQKHFSNKNGLEPFFYIIYALFYLSSISIVYAYVALYYTGFYSFIILAASVILSFLIYKKINPALTKIMSNENCFIQSRHYKGDKQKLLSFQYYSNTFYQISLILNVIIVLINFVFNQI